MALLRPRLSLGLVGSLSLPSTRLSLLSTASLTPHRLIRTGPPPARTPADVEGDDSPPIALGSPPPGFTPEPQPHSGRRADANPYISSSPSSRSSDVGTAPSSPPSSIDYADTATLLKERGGGPIEGSDTPDVRSGQGRAGESREGDAPLLLSADAPVGGNSASKLAMPESGDSVSREPTSPAAESSAPTSNSSSISDSPPASSTAFASPAGSASLAAAGAPSSSPASSSSSAPTQEDWEKKYEELQAAYHKKMANLRATMDERLKKLAIQTGETLALVSQKVNEVTGYREVEQLKQSVKDREREIKEGRRNVREAKKAYEDAVATLSSTQQSVNALLERKHSWTDADVANFTKLVRSDHASRSAVTTTNEALKNSELAVDKAFTGLMQSILERYHEEQVWSDKIRSVSTWAQVAALVANLIVFVTAIAFIEPWKRRRLVQGLEERVSGMMGRVEDEIQTLTQQIEGLDGKIALAAVNAATATPALAAPVAEAGAAPAQAGALTAEGAAAEGPNAEAVAQLMGALLSDLEVDDIVVNAGTSASPLAQVATATGDSYAASALAWTSAQLGHIAPPSAERDLAAASVIGAAAAMTAIGVCSLAASFFRP